MRYNLDFSRYNSTSIKGYAYSGPPKFVVCQSNAVNAIFSLYVRTGAEYVR